LHKSAQRRVAFFRDRGENCDNRPSSRDLCAPHARACDRYASNPRYEVAPPHYSPPKVWDEASYRVKPARWKWLVGLHDVRFGSKADIAAFPTNVRFTPKSGHR